FIGRDFTVVKIMVTAVVVGDIGIYALLPSGAVSLHIKPALWSCIAIGGTLFGIGMTVLRSCPGTGVVACGEGRKDAYVGLIGMFVGAAVYVYFYSNFSAIAGAWGDGGKLTLPSSTGTSPWLWIIPLAAVASILAWLGRRREKVLN
ncbi:MAG: YeeE/YedE thiosulfate transporter family protein, partial [Pirellula sp.]